MVRIMTMLIIRRVILPFLLGSLLASPASRAEDSPHWSKESCQTCHSEATPQAGTASLNAVDAEALCENCHGSRGGAVPCRHSSGIPVGDIEIAPIFQSSIKDGQIVCSTCHDIVYQCKNAKPHFSLQNRGFLRDRTSRNAGDYCFKCHNESAYSKLSPHQGIVGSPPRPTCLLCHEQLPESGSSGELLVEFNMRHDLNDTCRGCHKTPPHPKAMTFSTFAAKAPDGWIHLIEPSEKILATMEVTREVTGTVLPLDPQSGEVFCATCHNPHDFKVGGEHGSQSRQAKNRLRVDNICQACHEK
jgi:hypothetical protein